MAGSFIARNFEKFVSIFSPSLTGGILNIAFKPVKSPNGTTLLDVNTFDMNSLVGYAKQMFLSTKQSYPVLEVLPKELQPAEVKNSTYMIQIILLGVAFLITLGMVFGVLIIPCTWCCCRKRSIGKSPSRICYIVLMAITGAFLLYLALCLPLVFVSITSVASGIDGNSSKADNRGFKETFAVVVTQTSAFLHDMPVRGRRITSDLINYAQKSLEDSLSALVKNLLNTLLVDFGVRALSADAKILSHNVTELQNLTGYLLQETQTTVNAITAFKTTMENHKSDLENNLKQVCGQIQPQQPQQCTEFQNKLNNLKFDFDPTKVKFDQDLVTMISTFGSNLTDVLSKFDQMEKNVDAEVEKIIQEIKAKFDLAKELQSLTKIWDQVNTEVSEPVIGELNKMKPTVDSSLDMASKYIKMGGYAVLAVFSVVLVILLINWIVIVVQAALDRTPSSKAITAQMVCGLIIPAVFCFLVPLLVLVGGAVILVTGLISNEGCRYVGNPNGVAITDGATNLYLQYMWPKQFEQGLDPTLQSLLNIPIPQDVLNGVLVKCNGAGAPGFLPSIGINQFLNASAALDQPQLQQAVNNAESELVKQIKGLNFKDTLNFNITQIKELIAEVDKILTKTDYKPAIDALKAGMFDPKPISTLLDELEKFIDSLPVTTETQNTKTTINAMRNDLKTTDSLHKQIQNLIDAFEALQHYGQISTQLTKFGTELENVYNLLSDPAKLETPIVTAYRANVNSAMEKLVDILQNASTRFADEVITCSNLNKVATSVIGVTCANDGLFNRLGAFFFTLLLFLCPLELTVMLFQISLKTHGNMASG